MIFNINKNIYIWWDDKDDRCSGGENDNDKD